MAISIPNFGELLAEHLQGVPAAAYPFLLSQLERTAADRYRSWAEQVSEHRSGLLACAASEDTIADRVEALFPPSSAHRALVDAMLPAAKATYYAVFDAYTPYEQMQIQAQAERQGASAWQNLKQAFPQHAAALDELSAIEVSSADYLDGILSVELTS